MDVVRGEVVRVPVGDLLPEDPSRLGPYRLLGRLGAGGMGRVFLAAGPDGGTVAVKTLNARPEPVALQRMAREVAALGAAAHPRLARLVDHDLAAPVPWLAMEYVAGPALHEVALPLDPGALDRLAVGLAEALAALHAAGIVHRDVKPANVVLGFDGPVLVDLGIAHHADTTGLTQAGSVIGSPGWLAPEQLRGQPVTPAADVWGWAGLVALAGTGRPAFGAGDPRGLGWRVLHDEPDLDGVPPRWRPLVHAALRKDAAARPSAGTLAAAVPAARPAGLPLAAAPPEPVTTVTQEVPDAATLPGAPRRSSPGRRLAAVAAVLGICAAAGVAGYRWGDARDPAAGTAVPAVVQPSVQQPAAEPPQLAEAQPVTGDTARVDSSGPGSGRSGSGRGGSGSGRSGGGSGGPGRG